MVFDQVAALPIDAERARVFEHGWQSWSPTGTYPAAATSPRPDSADRRQGSYRPETPAPDTGFQGEGLLAVDPGDGGPVRVFAASAPEAVPSIRATLAGGELLVSADGPVDQLALDGPLDAALAGWATGFAGKAGVGPVRPAPTVWCSWYHYFRDVTEADIAENVAALGGADLPVDVVQIDAGWEAEVGDWLLLSDRFASLDEPIRRIRGAGRRAGIWVAPFAVAAGSVLAREHPEWLIGAPDGAPTPAGQWYDQPLYGLDATHPGAAGYLRRVFGGLAESGIDYFKIDFLYAGAVTGSRHGGLDAVAGYRAGLQLIRDAIGPDSYLLGCGAPVLPSVGLFDAMRVSPDTAPHYEPDRGDVTQPGQRSATLATVARAWQHGRFWVNDPDCLIVRPAVERRAEWAALVARYGGLRASSDRIADLDEWGLATTRRLLSEVPPPTPFAG
ncbi:MAG TPA: glycoside hydrolase family 36 protein [Pilimelia sp.]|nr:glycoside hydrolase family 36 protein [Pilimelia sp.]